MKKIILSILGISFFALTSCKNDDDSSINSTIEHPISFIELTGGNNQLDYKLISLTADKEIDYNEDGQASKDVLSQYQKCELDDLFIFTFVKSKNTYVWSNNENVDACSSYKPYENKVEGKFNPNPTDKTIEFFDDKNSLLFKATNVKLVEQNTPTKITYTLTFDFYDTYFGTTLHYKYVKEM